MQTLKIEIAESQQDLLALHISTGLTFHSNHRAAAMERLGNSHASLFVDTKDGVSGYFVNVVAIEGQAWRQWVAKEGNLDFWQAVNRMATLGTMSLSDFALALSDMQQIC
jgi:hypothetical protein